MTASLAAAACHVNSMNRVSENDDDETIYCVMQTRTNLVSCLRTAQISPHKGPLGFSTVAAAGLAIAGVGTGPIEVNAILAIVTLFFPAHSSRQQRALAEHPTEHAFPAANHVRKPVGVASGEARLGS
jgi:hypothetical protein